MTRDKQGRVRFRVDGCRVYVTATGTPRVYATDTNGNEWSVSTQKRTAVLRKYSDRVAEATAVAAS